ncbi:MAG: prepilin-type N-terminal cleavage/methylation domain-containing protein [Candidatus Cloacimonas sp.]|jgi:Tfp pilus assembly protein PilE|nr:prepilin-type N-terminal cleavage/methylation domain-containing protein [Candidatus Cloacimonadota bacterium]
MLFRKALQNDRGLTLIEVLVALIVIVFSLIALYTSLVYAESQLNRNYNERVATLLASGELDRQYYLFKTNGEFSLYENREVVINAYDETTDMTPLTGHMTVSKSSKFDLVSGGSFNYQTLKIKITWKEPSFGDTFIDRELVVQEDFYK